LRTKASKAKERIVTLVANVTDLKAERASMLYKLQFRTGAGKHVSTYGGYVLAAARALAHTGAAACAVMVAGQKERGDLKDPHTVIQYEHRMSGAMRVRSTDLYTELGNECDFSVHEIKCDATHQTALNKEKVHVCLVTSTEVSSTNLVVKKDEESGAWDLPLGEIAKHAVTQRNAADLQVVKHGTGAELYNLLGRELESVGCPSWRDNDDVEGGEPVAVAPSLSDRVLNGEHQPPRRRKVRIYSFGTDAGPEHIGFPVRLEVTSNP
jgi:hypothetical protein